MTYDRDKCIELLQNKQEKTEGRYVCRADFTDDEVAAIKSFLGPWPRALEAAGIKPERDFSRIEKNREKRQRARRRRREAKNAEKSENITQSVKK